MFALLSKIYLILNFIVYAGYALAYMIAPKQLGAWIGVTFHNSAALADYRAIYGGLSFAIAVLIALGLARASHARSALWICVLGSGGLLLGRVVTLLVDGPGNAYIYACMVLEVLGVVVGALLLRPRIA